MSTVLGYSLNLKLLVFVLAMGIGLEAVANSFFVACQVQGREDPEGKVLFLQNVAGAESVARYSVTWEMVDSISGLTASLLLRNVPFPLLVNFWGNDRDELNRLVQESVRWLIAVAIPIMFFLAAESDRLITLLYGPAYGNSIWMQRILVITILMGFLHNLAAYLMISMNRQNLLLVFYLGGLAVNLALCSWLIPANPFMGAVLSIVLTKGVVAVATVSFCQMSFGLISLRTLGHLAGTILAGGLLYLLGTSFLFREAAEVMALVPIVALTIIWGRRFSLQRKEASRLPASG